MSRSDDLPRIRTLALASVALVVTAAGAVTGDARAPVIGAAAVVLAAVSAWRWRRAGRTALSTSAAVAAVLVGLLLVEQATGDVDVVLGVTAAVALAAAWLLSERRLAVSGMLSLAVLLGRPLPDGETFRHCLVATDVVVPLPRLAGPTWLAVAALALGTGLRWSGWGDRLGRTTVARGLEMTGAIGLVVLLLVRAAELPGHRMLCGAGDALDEGWAVAGITYGIVAAAYGVLTRDVVWEASGLAAITGQGLLATTLTATPWWAAACAVLLVGALGTAERLGVSWPDRPGYVLARPGLDRVRRLRAGASQPTRDEEPS